MVGSEMPKNVDPKQTVRQAIDNRRGFASQADITETKRAVARIGSVGDNPEQVPGPFRVKGDLNWDGSSAIAWPIDGDDQELAIKGVADGVESYYFYFTYTPGAAGFQAKNLATDIPYFGLGSFTPTDDPYMALYDAAFRIYDVAGGTLRFSIDPATGSITSGEKAEVSQVNVAGNTNGALGASRRRYSFYTLPTTSQFFIITGIEWRVGGNNSGTIYCGVDLVSANPPASSGTALLATGRPVAVGALNTNQRNSDIASMPIRGGSVIGAWIAGTNNAATFGKTTVSSNNNSKAIAAAAPDSADFTAWTATTDEWFIKVYYRAYL